MRTITYRRFVAVMWIMVWWVLPVAASAQLLTPSTLTLQPAPATFSLQPALIVNDIDIVPNPRRAGIFFSSTDVDGPVPLLNPVAGAVLRVLVESPKEGPLEVMAQLADLTDSNDIPQAQTLEAWIDEEATVGLPDGTIAIALQLPYDVASGRKLVRVGIGESWTSWTYLEVAEAALLAPRLEVATQAAEALIDPDAGIPTLRIPTPLQPLPLSPLSRNDTINTPTQPLLTIDTPNPLALQSDSAADTHAIIGPYRPLPLGAVIRNGLTGDTTHRIDTAGNWLFYAFEVNDGSRQPGGTWLVIDGETGQMTTAADTDGWPVVNLPGQETPWFDAGAPGVMRQQAFETSLLPRSPQWGLHAPPRTFTPIRPTPTGTWTADNTPFSGNISEELCPNGIKKIAVILQLDDRQVKVRSIANGKATGGSIDAFSQKAAQAKAMFQALGFHAIYHITPAELVSGRVPSYRTHDSFHRGKYQNLFGLDLDAFDQLMRQIAKNADCCTEVVVMTLSHGLRKPPESSRLGTESSGHHYLKYSHMVNGKLIAEDAITSTDLSEMIVEAFLTQGFACTPLTIILNACYSGLGVTNAFDQLKTPVFGQTRPNVQIIGSSSGSQKTRARPTGTGGAEYFFLDSLQKCLSGSQRLSDNKVWDCIRKHVEERARQGVDKAQSPKRKSIP